MVPKPRKRGGLGRPLDATLDSLTHGWVVPYGALLLVFAAYFARFARSFPAKYLLLFGASGAIYVTGALGLEIAAAPRARHFGYGDPTFLIYCAFEEVMEFVGILLFLYSLLAFIAERRSEVMDGSAYRQASPETPDPTKTESPSRSARPQT